MEPDFQDRLRINASPTFTTPATLIVVMPSCRRPQIRDADALSISLVTEHGEQPLAKPTPVSRTVTAARRIVAELFGSPNKRFFAVGYRNGAED